MSTEPFDLDFLWGQDPIGLSTQDLDAIIAHERRMRAQREAGIRTKKPKDSAPSKLDVSSLLAKPVIGGGGIKRRF
jgi:hypothetical protein